MRFPLVCSRTVSKRGFIVLFCSRRCTVGAVDKGVSLGEGRLLNHDMSVSDRHMCIPSLEPLRMFQGHESYGPDGVALRWVRGGMYGVVPPAQFRDIDAGDKSKYSVSSAAARDGLWRTVTRCPALGISETSKVARERRVEHLLTAYCW